MKIFAGPAHLDFSPFYEAKDFFQNRARGPWPTICRAAALHPPMIMNVSTRCLNYEYSSKEVSEPDFLRSYFSFSLGEKYIENAVADSALGAALVARCRSDHLVWSNLSHFWPKGGAADTEIYLLAFPKCLLSFAEFCSLCASEDLSNQAYALSQSPSMSQKWYIR